MAWNDSPPTKQEIQSIPKRWDAEPPSDLDKSVMNLGKDWKDQEIMGGLATPRGIIKGGLEALPTAGMLAGGAVGTGLGPLGAVGGAGLGAAGGKALQQLGEKYLLGEEAKSNPERAAEIAQEGLLSAAGEAGGSALGKAGEALAATKYGQKGLELLGTAGKKLGHALTGVSENEIQTYAKQADKIKDMAKSFDNNTMLAADEARNKFYTAIDDTRKGMNEQISNALKNSSKEIDAQSTIRKLIDAKSNINEKLYPDDIKQIDNLIGKIRELGTETEGKTTLSVQDANELKRYMQEQASTAYRGPGQIFQLGTKAAQGAKQAGAELRTLINKAEPDIASANEKLARLHHVEDLMNTNLIAEGKPEAALMSAGTRGNMRNVEHLKELGELTGTNMLGEADKLAAMRTFGSPALMAVDTTGKSAARMGLGAGLGYLAGGDKEGALAGALLTSPLALRSAIDLGLLGKSALGSKMGQQLMTKGLLENYLNQGQ